MSLYPAFALDQFKSYVADLEKRLVYDEESQLADSSRLAASTLELSAIDRSTIEKTLSRADVIKSIKTLKIDEKQKAKTVAGVEELLDELDGAMKRMSADVQKERALRKEMTQKAEEQSAELKKVLGVLTAKEKDLNESSKQVQKLRALVQ